MVHDHDTIVALSSPLGAAPRAIVRLSGPRALAIACRVFTPSETIPEDATYESFGGAVELPLSTRSLRLPAALFLMRAPRSYTREEVVELHLAGNAAIVGELLAALGRHGARPAAPGEFTARAFAAGRLDLAQAEAVMAIIAANGRRSLAAAERLLRGQLSQEVTALVDRLRGLLAKVELAIDFSEEGLPIITAGAAADEARRLRDAVVGLGRRCRQVTQLDGDLRVALVGRPSVGKSSLFNALSGAGRAIVSPEPGTTRDELRETFTIGATRFVLSDTAGLEEALSDLDRDAGLAAGRGVADCREPSADAGNRLRRAAQRRTMATLAEAELVLVVAEAARVIGEGPTRAELRRLLSTLAAPAILVMSKCDLAGTGEPFVAVPFVAVPGGAAGQDSIAARARQALGPEVSDVRIVATSARTGQGLDELRSTIVETLHLGELDRAADAPAVAARHRRCLESAAEALGRAIELCGAGGPDDATAVGSAAIDEELLALELREALDALSAIIGHGSPQDVLREIFAGFCIGK